MHKHILANAESTLSHQSVNRNEYTKKKVQDKEEWKVKSEENNKKKQQQQHHL